MTNALTSVSHSRISQSRALVRSHRSDVSHGENASAGRSHRIDPTHAAHPTASRPHPAYVAAFVAQAIANDNGQQTAPHEVARAYWDMNYRLADLPTGFLISRSV